MFKLDDKFLEELGLGAMPDEQKQAFLQHIYSELEVRVGEKLTDGMSDELLDEFGNFVDQNADGMKKWFDEYLPDYADREDFKQLKEANQEAPETAVMSEYGAMKWLQLNRPDYPEVVTATLEELKNEIKANKDAILGGNPTSAGADATDEAAAFADGIQE
ncbi:DUF5663 domain-containing protein [Candidatus Saccharibacteria bacterium]|nr:DUF5663 domain-containing protein [Candidatus Saccharibacteria bacterium]MCL1963147.1 DUF5663 domain-containing protein [Candidatus Saccharibacteria bacterium]